MVISEEMNLSSQERTSCVTSEGEMLQEEGTAGPRARLAFEGADKRLV